MTIKDEETRATQMLTAAKRYIRSRLVMMSSAMQYAMTNHADASNPLGRKPEYGAPVFERNTVVFPMTVEGYTFEVTIALVPSIEQQRAFLVAESTMEQTRVELMGND